MTTFSFDAQVTAALFDKTGAIFALGDGSVRFESGARSEVHDGAVLCACVHPSGEGIVTGGDDGKLVWSREGEAVLLAQTKGQWIDAVAASAESGLIAFSSGRTLSVLDSKDVAFRRAFQHERTVSGVAFDPKGRRIAASTYGGAWLWYARIEQQQPTKLAWAGSHLAVGFSTDGAFVVTAIAGQPAARLAPEGSEEHADGRLSVQDQELRLPGQGAAAGHLGRARGGAVALRRRQRPDGPRGDRDRL